MEILVLIILIIVGFFMLLKGADLLVGGASSLARKFNISELAIGLTIVALGTSAPELVVNIISGYNNHDEVVFGNIIGSNIFNLFLILGISGTIYPIIVQKNTVAREVPFSLVITIILYFLLNDNMIGTSKVDGTSHIDGIILLILFVGFLLYVLKTMKNNLQTEESTQKIYSTKSTIIRIILGLVGLGFGGHFVVENAVELAEIFEVSQKMIGLTIVAAGTSLPELATSAIAAYKRQSDIAIGNVIGSNIFNILFVLGVSSVLNPLEYNTVLNTDLYILMGGTLLLIIFMFTLNKKKLDRYEAVLFLLTFIGYMTYLFYRK